MATTESGQVSAFDERRGLGEITAADGAVYGFHATAIADGTRTITVGAEVQFEVRAGRRGNWEAARIKPATS